MKEKINKFVNNVDKVKVVVENKKWKNLYKKLAEAYDILYIDNISSENEMMLLKQDIRTLQMEKREYLNAYKHIKEEHRRLKMMLMKEGTTLKDIKNAMGVK